MVKVGLKSGDIYTHETATTWSTLQQRQGVTVPGVLHIEGPDGPVASYADGAWEWVHGDHA